MDTTRDPRPERGHDDEDLRRAEEEHRVDPGEVREDAPPEVREGEREE